MCCCRAFRCFTLAAVLCLRMHVPPPLNEAASYVFVCVCVSPQGRRVGSRKEGDGVYLFRNGDVYEGEFKHDRMDGHGVYTFR